MNAEVHEPNNVGWTEMWRLDILPKVKNFFWRACNLVLPTADVLVMKQVRCNTVCCLCQSELESVLHVLVECNVARMVWFSFDPGISVMGFGDFTGWVSHHMKLLSSNKKCLMIMLCWSIWNARNDNLWNNHPTGPRAIMENARLLLERWREVQNRKHLPSLLTQVHDVKWNRPPL